MNLFHKPPRIESWMIPFLDNRSSAVTPEQQEMRLQCLKLAAASAASDYSPEGILYASKIFYNFVTGSDRAALADEAKAAVDKLAK